MNPRPPEMLAVVAGQGKSSERLKKSDLTEIQFSRIPASSTVAPPAEQNMKSPFRTSHLTSGPHRGPGVVAGAKRLSARLPRSDLGDLWAGTWGWPSGARGLQSQDSAAWRRRLGGWAPSLEDGAVTVGGRSAAWALPSWESASHVPARACGVRADGALQVFLGRAIRQRVFHPGEGTLTGLPPSALTSRRLLSGPGARR